jgi:hypothetical protein
MSADEAHYDDPMSSSRHRRGMEIVDCARRDRVMAFVGHACDCSIERGGVLSINVQTVGGFTSASATAMERMTNEYEYRRILLELCTPRPHNSKSLATR